MFLFVGLGNKGEEYKKTRHNVGFLALDILAKIMNVENTEILKFCSSVFSFNFESEKIICAKPQTFVNLSGRAAIELVQFYKIPISNVFVFHDDIDLALGKVKFKIGGGSGGHNGLKSLDQTIGPEYTRIRIGVGRGGVQDVAKYVLSNFKREELEVINANLEKILQNLKFLLEKQFSKISQSLV